MDIRHLLIVVCAAQTFIHCTATTGVQFIPDKQIYTSYNTWAVSMSIDLQPYTQQLTHLERSVTNLHKGFDRAFKQELNDRGPSPDLNRTTDYNNLVFIQGETRKMISTSVSQFQSECAALKSRLQHIKRSVINSERSGIGGLAPRRKRSLIPWAGGILGTLFGLATESNMRRFKSKLAHLSNQQGEIIHVVENSLTLLNKTNVAISRNRNTINSLSLATGQLHDQIDELVGWSRYYGQLTVRNHMMTQTLAVFNLIAASLREAGRNIDQLETEIATSMQGHLSISLVNPWKLREILVNIRYHLPSTMSLPRTNQESLAWYYQHLPTMVIPGGEKIHILTIIPIGLADSLYDMFTVISMAIPVLNTNKSTRILIEGKHLAISSDRTRYVIVTELEARWSCPRFNIDYCPLSSAIASVSNMPSCVSSLFLSDANDITEMCHVELTENILFPQVKHLLKGNWIIASNVSFPLHIKCDTVSVDRSRLDIRPPIQVIKLESGCTGYADMITLPAYFHSTTETLDDDMPTPLFNLDDLIPNIWRINSSDYPYKLVNTQPWNTITVPKLLPEVDSIDLDSLKLHTSKIDKHVKKESHSDSLYIVLYCFIGLCILLILAIIVLLYLQYHRRVSLRCCVTGMKDRVNENNGNINGPSETSPETFAKTFSFPRTLPETSSSPNAFSDTSASTPPDVPKPRPFLIRFGRGRSTMPHITTTQL